MAISTTIHKINTEDTSCIVTVYDDGKLIIDRSNIGLELNPDGTANTQWISERLKNYVFGKRLHDLESATYPDIE